MIVCGIDNGVSGSIGFINGDESLFLLTPIKLSYNYQKKAKKINRIDFEKLEEIFSNYPSNIKVFMERPLINPARFEATASALRAYEATIITFERLKIAYDTIDSKSWQKELLPEGIKGSENLKRASLEVGCRLFPQHSELIKKHKDADGILIAEWARRNKL